MLNKKALFALLALPLASCVGSQHEATFDAVVSASGLAFVEGFIEYAGPQAKWAGPVTVVAHVSAYDNERAELRVSPQFFRDGAATGAETAGRKPASQGLTTAYARERLNELANAMQDSGGAADAFRGCLYPVRARLVRTDGSVVEKQGCRAQTGWPRAASETISLLISATLGGSPAVVVPSKGH
jgi:hypothetical protein